MARSLLLLLCLYSVCVLSAPDPATTTAIPTPTGQSENGDTCDADPVWTSSSTTSSPPTTTTAPPTQSTGSTAAPTPPLAINLSNNTVSVGDENSKNNGTDLRITMYKILQALCLQPAGSCTSTQDAEIDKIKSLSPDDQPDDGHLNFTITDSSYNSPKERDQMLGAAVVAWQQAVANTCKEVPYRGIPSTGTQNDCTTGPVKERREGPTDGKLEDRSPIREDPCKYNADLCVGPDHISIMLGNATDPYANHLNIDISWTLDKKPVNPWAVFVCELVIDLLTAAVIELAPVLAEEDIFASLDLSAKCSENK